MIANIASDDALILPHRANPAGLNFRERQARYLAGAAGEREFLRYKERRTKALVDHFWNEIELVARALLERDQLSGTEVKNIIEAPRRLKQEDRADEQRWIEAMAADELGHLPEEI